METKWLGITFVSLEVSDPQDEQTILCLDCGESYWTEDGHNCDYHADLNEASVPAIAQASMYFATCQKCGNRYWAEDGCSCWYEDDDESIW